MPLNGAGTDGKMSDIRPLTGLRLKPRSAVFEACAGMKPGLRVTWITIAWVVLAVLALQVQPCNAQAKAPDVLPPGLRQAWLALLHSDADGTSRVDSAAFFLSAGGAHDAYAEWQATRQAFQRDPTLRCRFPARWQVLRSHDAALAALPEAPCPAYQAWRDRRDIRGLTLVFASSYLGNPSSAFGHTFLRLDSDGSPLLAWAVNFAAQTQDDPGLSYALKGLSGGYVGRFGLGPYYDKVAEYAYLEQRALWEYRLALSAAEIDLLLAHLWELREAEFDYFFFDENCSFQLLALLQVSRPELPLTHGFSLFAAPLDTIRRLQRHGLVEQVSYRPALRASLRQRIDQLSAAEQRLVQQGLKDADATLPQQARALEVVADLARYRSATGVLGRAPSAARRDHYLALESRALAARSGLPEAQAWQPLVVPERVDQSHASQRVSAGLRVSDEHSELMFGWRPVLHDLLDGVRGLSPDSEIAVLDTRVVLRAGTLRVHELSLIKVRSLPPRDAWFKPWSWQVDVGYRRPFGAPSGLWRGGGGLGMSWCAGVRLSLLVQAGLVLGEGGQRGIEQGAQMRLRGRWNADWPWQLSLRWARRHGQLSDDDEDQTRIQLGQQWQLNPHWALRAQAWHARSGRQNAIDIRVMRYF